MNQDTICAIATAQGGAIGCIRVSGPEAIEITSRIFTPAIRELGDSKPYTLTFGRIYDGSEVIDEVLVSLFRAPHSYTGENSTEITCHGSAYILQKVLQLLIKNGCLRHFFRNKTPFFDLYIMFVSEGEDRFEGMVVFSVLLHVVKRGIHEIPLALCADNQHA